MKAFPGLGRDDLVPTPTKRLDPAGAGLTAEDYFVYSRVDGRTSLRQLVLISGFSEARAVAILRKLRDAGAISLPGAEARGRPSRPEVDRRRGTVPPTEPPRAPRPPRTSLPRALGPVRLTTPATGVRVHEILAEDVELTAEEKHAILAKHASLQSSTLFAILEVSESADRRSLTLAYHTLSKRYHPDRHFRKRLGSYKQLLTEIFDVVSSAFDVLRDGDKREMYLASLSGAQGSERTALPSPGQLRLRAVQIFEDACNDQALGDLGRALSEFSAAIALDAQPRYLRRAAEAALQAQELREAEDYAKKATELDPDHASGYRILAKVLSATGRRREACQALEIARQLDPTNPKIVAELRALDGDAGPHKPRG